MKLPRYLAVEIADGVATLTMNRPEKRNAMCDDLLHEIDAFFCLPPPEVKAVVLTGAAGLFCSGLDLSEYQQRDAEGIMRLSHGWHEAMDRIQFSGLPAVSAMSGAVIGSGLELAAATHVRIAEPSTIFQLPEAQRGVFVGGGTGVRVGRILGTDRLIEMMLTGREYGAEEGLALGLAHYSVGESEALPLAQNLARKIARNAPLSNYVMIRGLSRVDDASRADGRFTESLCAALTQTGSDDFKGLRALHDDRDPTFR